MPQSKQAIGSLGVGASGVPTPIGSLGVGTSGGTPGVPKQAIGSLGVGGSVGLAGTPTDKPTEQAIEPDPVDPIEPPTPDPPRTRVRKVRVRAPTDADNPTQPDTPQGGVLPGYTPDYTPPSQGVLSGSPQGVLSGPQVGSSGP